MGTSIRKHAGAIGFVVLLAGLTATTWAAAQTTLDLDYHTQSVIASFVRTEPNGINEAGNPFSGAKFDFSGFITHPCYVIVNEEHQYCAEMFGITSDLRKLTQNGVLLNYLRERNLLPFVVQQQEAASSSVDNRAWEATPSAEQPVTLDTLYRNRMSQLWDVCNSLFAGPREARTCYQRNIRLVIRIDNPVTQSNVH